jgi:hypothetical protein
MQRGEYKSTSKERKARWDACKQRWPLWLTKHRYQRNAEKDVSGRKRHILPTAGADLRKQMSNRVHRFPSVERRAAEALNPLLGQIASAVGFLREQGMTGMTSRPRRGHKGGKAASSRSASYAEVRRCQFGRVADFGLGGNAGLIFVPRMRSSAMLSALSSLASGGT